MTIGKLFCFGLGYSASALTRRLDVEGWQIGGTRRSPDKCASLRRLGIECAVFDGTGPLVPQKVLDDVTHVLISIPPGENGDLVLNWHGDDLARAQNLVWTGYLSSTGVYGDWGGAWVDETCLVRPVSLRARRRVAAENSWREWGERNRKPVHVFRLAGIYGSGRSAIDQVRQGTARRIVKPGQVFSRIHVEDIATVLQASIARPDPGCIYNVCDDLPAASSDVVAYACWLCGQPPPPEIPFEKADMSSTSRSFWADSRRVCNSRIKEGLGVELAYPDYRAGLRAIAGL